MTNGNVFRPSEVEMIASVVERVSSKDMAPTDREALAVWAMELFRQGAITEQALEMRLLREITDRTRFSAP